MQFDVTSWPFIAQFVIQILILGIPVFLKLRNQNVQLIYLKERNIELTTRLDKLQLEHRVLQKNYESALKKMAGWADDSF